MIKEKKMVLFKNNIGTVHKTHQIMKKTFMCTSYNEELDKRNFPQRNFHFDCFSFFFHVVVRKDKYILPQNFIKY